MDRLQRKAESSLALSVWFSLFVLLLLLPPLRVVVVQAKPKLAGDYGDIPGFYHGVASGSPRHDAMIIWTRYTPQRATDEVELQYRVAAVTNRTVSKKLLLSGKRNPKGLLRGRVWALPQHDWTVKLDVVDLKPKTTYVYAFTDLQNATSRVGRFQTAPAPDDNVTEGLNFAVFSCSNFRTGYFHLYDLGARLRRMDYWIHLGDYIYENYGSSPNPPNNSRAFLLEPKHKIVTLEDYRLRYASYHSDPALQLLRATAALIVTWDDHEVADNAHRTGSREHFVQSDGPWGLRVKAAVQAYLEWIPIRPRIGDSMGPYIHNVSITQTIELGRLATLVSFDTRLSVRPRKPSEVGDPIRKIKRAYLNQTHHNVSLYREEPLLSEMKKITSQILDLQNDPSHVIAGSRNVRYLRNAFAESQQAGKPWQIFAAPVLMGYNMFPPFDTLHQYAPPEWRKPFRQRLEEYIATDNSRSGGGRFRASIPLAEFKVCQALDDWCGSAVERAQLLDVFQEFANTPIVLGGDRHSSWAWTLYEGGNYTGKPVAINIGGPGVTAGGEGKDMQDFLEPLLESLVATNITTARQLFKVFDHAWEGFNQPGLQYANINDRGFFAVRLTPAEAFFEYFHVDFATLKTNYEDLRNQTGGSQLPPHYCGASLRSEAKRPGFLARRPQCDIFSFRKTPNFLLDTVRVRP